MSDVVFDIEVVGEPWDSLDGETREYLTTRAHKQAVRDGETLEPEAAEATARERLALELGLGRIVAIGIWDIEKSHGAVLLNGTTDIQIGGAVKTFSYADEAELLRGFWGIVAKYKYPLRLITFNGRTYDGPVVMVRSAQNGIACVRDLVGYRYDIERHCDLADCLNFQGSARSFYSLDYWCRRFGIDSPKEGVTGADVQELYWAGRLDEIGTYVLRDVRQTAALYQRLKPMLHVFKGGPTYQEAERVA